MKDGTIFYANNLVFFFEQFHDKIYEELPEFMVKKGMTIIDCGAASGEYTLYALQKGANLIAFEPEKKAFLNLEKNTKKYKNVKLYNLALSNKDTKTTKKMDSIIDTSMKIDILKIDVEGHEIEVLKGARKTLKNVDKIVMEIHTEELFKKCRKILTKEHKISRKDFNNIENAQPLLFAIRK